MKNYDFKACNFHIFTILRFFVLLREKTTLKSRVLLLEHPIFGISGRITTHYIQEVLPDTSSTGL